MDPIVNQYGTFWVGPFGVRIPWDISEVPTTDGVKSLTKEASSNGKYHIAVSELFGPTTAAYSAEEYRSLYCKLQDDGEWYWNAEKAAVAAKRALPQNPPSLWGGDPNW